MYKHFTSKNRQLKISGQVGNRNIVPVIYKADGEGNWDGDGIVRVGRATELYVFNLYLCFSLLLYSKLSNTSTIIVKFYDWQKRKIIKSKLHNNFKPSPAQSRPLQEFRLFNGNCRTRHIFVGSSWLVVMRETLFCFGFFHPSEIPLYFGFINAVWACAFLSMEHPT